MRKIGDTQFYYYCLYIKLETRKRIIYEGTKFDKNQNI